MVLILYIALLALLYFFQERLIFFPSKLEANYDFSFDQPFEEIRLDANGTRISGLKFLAQNRDGGQIYGDARDANGERKSKKRRGDIFPRQCVQSARLGQVCAVFYGFGL